MAKSWMGERPEHCDICKRVLAQFFVDGRMNVGVWAIMCGPCHKTNGVGLGTGKGQKYALPSLEKIEG